MRKAMYIVEVGDDARTNDTGHGEVWWNMSPSWKSK
ncbi:hypothetical protein [Oceanobacillus damuensis]